eukprot:1161846-Pelagomonas_calceolata.AAC.2
MEFSACTCVDARSICMWPSTGKRTQMPPALHSSALESCIFIGDGVLAQLINVGQVSGSACEHSPSVGASMCFRVQANL